VKGEGGNGIYSSVRSCIAIFDNGEITEEKKEKREGKRERERERERERDEKISPATA